MIFGQFDRPTVLERPEVHDRGLDLQTRCFVAVMADDLKRGAALVDHEVAGVVAQQVVRPGDDGIPLEDIGLAIAETAKRCR